MIATSFLSGLGNVDGAQATGTVRGAGIKANAHIHIPPNFSAFDTVNQVIDLAAGEGIHVLGASNYYDYTVYREFSERCVRRGIFPLFGLEIITLVDDLLRDGIKVNDPGNPGKFYVCGKGITRFDPLTDEATDLLSTIRRNDADRMERMTASMREILAQQGIDAPLTADGIRQEVAARHGCPPETVYLQERHIAQAVQEAIFERTTPENRGTMLEKIFGAPIKGDANDAALVQGEIRSRLMKAGKPAFVPETFVGFEHARRLILALGGIPCYPTLADGANPICVFEDPVEDLIDRIRERGLVCAELIPIRNQPAVLATYVRAMREAGLFVTAGTEHNTPDLLPLEPTAVQGQAIPDDVLAIFAEGACVLAAHQYRMAIGETGFVTEAGEPNPAFRTDAERIRAFARLGAQVLRRFQELHPPI